MIPEPATRRLAEVSHWASAGPFRSVPTSGVLFGLTFLNETKRKTMRNDYAGTRPDSDGYWLWREGGDETAVRLLLDNDGLTVAECKTDEPEGTPQYYWEQTSADQKTMPGLWMREQT